jgi:hypothetical protein
MKLYLEITKMTFGEDNIEHDIIRGMLNKEFFGYDEVIELPDDDKFIQDTLRETKEGIVFDIREKDTWWGFPLYQVIEGKIVPFNWEDYSYFSGADRRNTLARRINQLYNPSSELKVLRKTFEFVLNELNLSYPIFDKYNKKVNDIIDKNPKN